MPTKRFSVVTLLMVFALALASCVQPTPIPATEASGETAAATKSTSGETAAAPDQIAPGGVWTRVSSTDASNLNPITQSDAPSADISGMLFPGLIGVDPVTGEIVPEGSMSESWEVSADGLTWTFHLREGVVWSDGDPVDAADFKYTYDAVASELVETPRKSNVESIASIEVIDPLTVIVTFKQVKCDGLLDVGLAWLPSHLFAEDFSDIMQNEFNEAPSVSAGPFLFQSWTAG